MTTSKDKKISLIVKNKSLDYGLLIVVIVLLAIGLVTVLSASAHYSLRTEGDSYFYVKKQLLFALLGIISMLAISKVDYRIFNSRISYAVLIVAFLLLGLVFVPGIGVTRNNATRWIRIAGFQFQPSEIMKIAIIFFLATIISKNPKKIKEFWTGIVPCLVLIGAVAGLLLLQPHMSATIIIVVIAASMIFVAGARWRHTIPLGLAGIAAGALLVCTSEYRWKRVTMFLDPWQDPRGDGYQIIQSLYALASGGLFGVGLGKSVQKYLYIPEPHNDFIFAIWAEETGLFGAIVVMLLFGIFIWRGMTIALKATDMFGSLLATGITVMIGIQAIFSIAVVSSAMPVTGIPLPFFSYGGTALMILLSCVGILLSVSRHARK